MKLCICFGICLFSKWFCPRLTFLFSNLGLIMAQQTSLPVNCFMARGWHISCHPISKVHVVGEGPGETPSALRCLSYLVNSFLTDKTPCCKLERGLSLCPLLISMSEVSLSLLYFNKTLLHKKLQVAKPCLWPQIKILSSGGHKSWCRTWLTAATFHTHTHTQYNFI